MSVAPGEVASLRQVSVVRNGRRLLDDVAMDVHPGRPVAVLGPNGAGKTTLLRLLSTYLHPTTGSVTVLGARFGHHDLRSLRSRIGFVSVALTPLLQVTHTAGDLVAAARHGMLRRLPRIGAEDRDAAAHALARIGVAHLAGRECRSLSQGEWQRVQVARALVAEPDLLLLDEPFAGLDLGGRESLVADLEDLLADAHAPSLVMVSHHLEELPRAVADVVLLRAGRVMAAGDAAETLVDAHVSATFGVDVAVDRVDGRWAARVQPRCRATAGDPARPVGGADA